MQKPDLQTLLVSVIVPTYQSAAHLEKCLKSIRSQTYANLELIVVDNNSRDETKAIASKFADLVLNQGPERSAQRNEGVRRSRGQYLFIVDSDMELSARVVEAAVREIQSNALVQALVIPEQSYGEGFWSQCKALERSFYVRVEWMEAARFFRRSIFEEMGGYDERNTGTEDYDLPQRIEDRYGPAAIGRIEEWILHNEQRIELLKTCKKKFYYAKNIHRYLSVPANQGKFARQASLLARYQLFFSDPKRLLQDPVKGAGMLMMKTCEFGFGAAGFLIGKFLTK